MVKECDLWHWNRLGPSHGYSACACACMQVRVCVRTRLGGVQLYVWPWPVYSARHNCCSQQSWQDNNLPGHAAQMYALWGNRLCHDSDRRSNGPYLGNSKTISRSVIQFPGLLGKEIPGQLFPVDICTGEFPCHLRALRHVYNGDWSYY